MEKKINLLMGVIVFLLCLSVTFSYAQQEEQVTITTYYPSPYGSYREIRAQRMAIGDNYNNGSSYCWSPDSCTNQIDANADLVVEGNVGIGTVAPASGIKLDVNGTIRGTSVQNPTYAP